MRKLTFVIGAFVAALILPNALHILSAQQGNQKQQGQPTQQVRHVIHGVPFVRWGDGAALDAELNPSSVAVSAMVIRYWGYDPKKLLDSHDKTLESWRREGKDDSSEMEPTLGDLKHLINRELPVVVLLTLTPFAHYLNVSLAVEAGFHPEVLQIQPSTTSTGLLGPMIGLDRLEELAKIPDLEPLVRMNEPLASGARVVVGYDDERKVLILHDPSFGPGWEISYEDFDRMWSVLGRPYGTIYPPHTQTPPARDRSVYPARGPDNEASVRFVYGYARAQLGQLQEAEQELRRGLAISGIGAAYQHLLHTELSNVLNSTGRCDEAVSELEKAIEIYPDHSAPWYGLSQVLRCSRSDRNSLKRAEEAEKKFKKLCSEGAERKAARFLANDFGVLGCTGEILGWAIR